MTLMPMRSSSILLSNRVHRLHVRCVCRIVSLSIFSPYIFTEIDATFSFAFLFFDSFSFSSVENGLEGLLQHGLKEARATEYTKESV